MFNIFNKEVFDTKKIVTVEEIHQEFDDAQEKVLKEASDILDGIPTKDSRLERKALKLEITGFAKSELLQEYYTKNTEIETIAKAVEGRKRMLDSIMKFIQKYPYQKFITVDELDNICGKYGLIYAPVKHYIKDVPEKNLDEIVNRKELHSSEITPVVHIVSKISFWDNTPQDYQDFVNKHILNRVFPDKEMTERNFEQVIEERGWKDGKSSQYWFRKATVKTEDNAGLQVAAPESHFDLKGLKKTKKFGFAKVEYIETKDPIVFEYCKDNIVRIISKWGTDDDQSYLDESLINQNLN